MPTYNERLKKARALITEARALQMTFIHRPEPITSDALALVILNGIPLFNGLLKRLNSSTSAISKLVKKTGDAPTSVLNTANVTPFVGILLNILDFIQIPLIYLAAFALGEKPPITLSNNARWLYAGVLLALCLAAFLIPVAAPFIAIGSASLGFLAGTFTLGKLLQEYYEDKSALKVVMDKINTGPAGRIQTHSLELETACLYPSKNALLIDKLIVEIELIKQDCGKKKNDIKSLYKEAYMLEEKLKIETDVIDNCIGIALSALAVSGTVVSLFFPPAGLIILLTTALAGAAYVIARLAAPDFFAKSKNPSIITGSKDGEAPKLPGEQVMKGSTNILLSKFKFRDKNVTLKNKTVKNDSTPVVEKESATDVKKTGCGKRSQSEFQKFMTMRGSLDSR